VDTTQDKVGDGRRRRRRHSDEFKADAVAACRHAGVSIAAVAMSRGVNANLLRRWVADDERQRRSPRDAQVVPVAVSPKPAFLSVPVPTVAEPAPDIRIEIKRGATLITVSWPASAVNGCVAWLRELLQ
jgi:transposase